ncbi:hypothetical protein O7606_12490 [Micromonospora sp. WMMD882]|uniref:hypothetical protein n=1 Tax=Micromonospora sp. WMMD882 TaxID=3015151 RepID=UPI00248CC124|nr:hypothetical protein [Micromonospora sp. WMMD882]WBB82108.1 hypothetical protein O7606_12490 [Micromonospora sp. WMMD882]
MRLLITVKTAPRPSAEHGQAVCVGALGLDPPWTGWIRLHPVHFPRPADDSRFRRYGVVRLDALPARQDPRRESWTPFVDTITTEQRLLHPQARRNLLDPLVEDSMCRLNEQTRDDPNPRSIALIRVTDISALRIGPHPGWTAEQRGKIADYLRRPDLLTPTRRDPLPPPRFTGAYHYRCADRRCRGHQQDLWDGEFVAAQRQLRQLTDAEATERLRDRFLSRLCAADRDVAFFVGNQRKRPRSFSVGSVHAPG